jgi:hypothetical protein
VLLISLLLLLLLLVLLVLLLLLVVVDNPLCMRITSVPSSKGVVFG